MWSILTIVGIAVVVGALLRHTGKRAAPHVKRPQDNGRDP